MLHYTLSVALYKTYRRVVLLTIKNDNETISNLKIIIN